MLGERASPGKTFALKTSVASSAARFRAPCRRSSSAPQSSPVAPAQLVPDTIRRPESSSEFRARLRAAELLLPGPNSSSTSWTPSQPPPKRVDTGRALLPSDFSGKLPRTVRHLCLRLGGSCRLVAEQVVVNSTGVLLEPWAYSLVSGTRAKPKTDQNRRHIGAPVYCRLIL
jgi:hypothetical protein